MKKHIFSLLMLIFSISAFSQVDYTHEKNKVTGYELAITEYEKDKDAEALVIYDIGSYYFIGEDDRGFVLYMKRRQKIKILKQAGIKEATIEIPFYTEGEDWETVGSIDGATYNVDNGTLNTTALTSKNIFEEKVNDRVRVKKIAFSDVRVGSVIELEYLITTPYLFNMRKWDFQRTIPVVYSQLKYTAIPYYEYAYLAKGTEKFDEFNSEVRVGDKQFGNLKYKEMDFIFGMKDLPAFKDEEFITSKEDYLVGINFQLSKYNNPRGRAREIMTTWSAMSDDFLKDESFGKYISKTEKEAKKILPTLDIEGKEPIKQVEAIASYVKLNYNWNGFYGKYAPDELSEFLKKKTGNVGNINLFLIGMLKAANIDAHPVALSTRGNGIVSKGHPFQQFFNYVVAQVVIDGTPIYLDATESMLYFSDLPQRCINVEGLLVKPKSEEWVNILQKVMSTTHKYQTIKIIPEENKMVVNARYANSGFDGLNYRKVWMGKAENLSKYLKDKNNIDVKGEVSVKENDKLNRPFQFSFDFESSIEEASGKLFVNPFCNLYITENPFKQTARTLPVDLLYIRGEIYHSIIEVPQGYKIEHLPESYAIDNDLIKIDYTAQVDSNKIQIMGSYSLKKIIYPATDYNNLKTSFADMIKKYSDMIVFVKE